MMPKGSGLEVTTYVRSRHPSIPVIVVSGSGNAQTAALLLQEGAVDYLAKPVEPEQLIAAVQKAVKGRLQAKDQSAM
jgi:two-component system response regulator FlrC